MEPLDKATRVYEDRLLEEKRPKFKLKDCPKCGHPEGLIYCPTCHGPKKAKGE
jgi:hypothetical protein